MRISLVTATLALVGAGTIGMGATFATQPYVGSDSLYNLTNGALVAAGLGNNGDYSGGGSAAGESAMAATTPTQWTAPMTKMMATTTCSALRPTHASGVVLGLDAVDIYSSTFAGAAPPGGTGGCSGQTNGDGLGLAYSTSLNYTNYAGQPATLTFKNWTDVLALLYGGYDKSESGTAIYTDCDSPQRQALVANWANLFQASTTTCTQNPTSACTTATYKAGGGVSPTNSPFGTASGNVSINGALWHAFRRDDSASTSDVLASLIGLGTIYAQGGSKLKDKNGNTLSYSVSASKNNGFGVSPYCNALNWDTTAANEPAGTPAKHCQLGAYHQFVGPGGIPEPNAGVCSVGAAACSPVGSACSTGGTCNWDGIHRRPPHNTWGDASSEPVASNIGADVMPTSYQDNDPIRRPCLGLSNLIGAGKPGEEVCNIDNPAGAGNGPPGQLGLVLPIPALDWLGSLGATACNGSACLAFPTNACGAFASGAEMTVLHCATSGTKNNVCPDGAPINGGCQLPVNAAGTSDQCENNPSKWPTGTDTTQNDGRIFNLVAYDGTTGGGPEPYAIPGTTNTIPFTGAFSRIHQTVPIWDTTKSTTPPVLPGTNPSGQTQGGCQSAPASDQMGCLAQADPCSIAYEADDGKTWNERSVPPLSVSGIDALQVSQVYPTTATVQNQTYPGWRKLYFNSSNGFDGIDGGVLFGTDNAVAELALGQYESNTASVTALLSTYSYFSLGHSPNGTGGNTPYCEDFNEQMLCDGGIVNQNACNFNLNALSPANNSAIPSGTTASFAAIPADPSPFAIPDAGAGISGPTTSTVCGNGVTELFEDCDDGLLNGTTGDPCNTICRLVEP
jgi:cysteine-rich repeat protein